MTGRINIEGCLLATALGVFALLLIMEKMRPYKKLAALGLKRSFSTNASAFMAIPRSRDNPKILGRDDAEIVGDRIA